ncbi:sterol desaturase/sphingolipid hydroxylase (fatty acid hydroxylase superfamily) [Pedobacter sp. UYP24]
MNLLKYIIHNHPASVQVILFLTTIIVLWLWELRVTLSAISKWRHTKGNLKFIITALPIQLCLSVGIIAISVYTSLHNLGILNLIPFGSYIWLKYLCGFFLLDLFEYIYHRVMHKIPSLWRFHQIHHSDEDVDVSTTLREHPVETVIRLAFQMVWVFLSGASLSLLLLRQTIQTLSNLFAHSSYRLPATIENIFSKLFITPGLHHVHHHFKMPYTDCNYGDVLSIWDRLLGTYKELPKSEITYGIDCYPNAANANFKGLVARPFLRKQL